MAPGSPPLIVIEPRRGWSGIDLRALWTHRELLSVFTVRNIKVRYKQSVLGVTWALIRPVMSMVVFTVLFGQMAKIAPDGDYPYSVWVYSALLPWTFFASAVGTAAESLLSSAHLVSKVYFPRLLIPMAAVGAALVDFVLATLVLFVMMVIHGIAFTPALLLLPVLVLWLALVALGVGAFLAALLVSFRDIRHATPFLLQTWMFLTPVIYPPSLVPESKRWLLGLNPVAGMTEASRAVFLGKPIDAGLLASSVAGGVVLVVFGLLFFARAERRFADVI